ncbi:glycerophosphodiester phosphodiesterase family protein [Actinomadura luteofluorescens]|uniref:Glycerophosphoryl diester phosphodiesterase n=1 Tax=Actinomadura luteofluorescens TaxID=46163 RepID=A0A7Y9EDK6_9ACTN|nr:glycerophosphodiester phosphodiesterase family protein [Actinomadura luteofluorescens]NYD45825.1 glycerophosphoryl diester phosphodiesterase [Actinomadura luteofluorescens]
MNRIAMIGGGAVLAAALAFAGSAQAAPQAAGKRAHAVIVGHRGSPGQAPEETLASYRDGVRDRADVLEGDVQLTADKRIVLLHDDTLARTTDVEQVFPDRAPWRVGQFTLDEIKRLDAGSWFDARYAGQRVPTLKELLAVRSRDTGLSLELKAPANSPGIATLLAEELNAARLTDGGTLRSGAYRVHVHSRDQTALQEFHASAPKVQLSYLTGGKMLSDDELAALAGWTVSVYAHPRATSADDVRRAHAKGLKVFSDPVDSPAEVSMGANQGYDWLATNFPATTRRILDGRTPFPGANGVVIDSVFPDPSGDDAQPEKSEHVVLRNTTSRPVDVSGGYLRDQASNLMRIGSGYVIPPGSLLRVYVGPGTNRPDAYYNGLTAGFLNNTSGDTVSFFQADHTLLDISSYIVP